MANYTETFTSVNGDVVDASELETQFDDIATAIATKLDSDGSGAMTGALSMGSNKITNVTDPTADQEAATKAYVDGRSVEATKQNTTSGTEITFGSIPSWVTQITLTLVGVSISTTGNISLRIGDSGGLESSGYTSAWASVSTGSGSGSAAGWRLNSGQDAANAWHGQSIVTLHDSSANTWVHTSQIITSGGAVNYGGGSKSLDTALTQIAIVASAGTFDAGAVNIVYR